MASIFYAVYDDAATTIPLKIIHKNPITVYRTSNMELIEQISGMGFEPKAVMLEEDIELLMQGNYSNDDISEEEMAFLVKTASSWSFPATT